MSEKYGGEETRRIALWFVPHTVPYGTAPEHIKEQWIGIPLPVRDSHVFNPDDEIAGHVVGTNIDDPTDIVVRTPDESVVVETGDAFKALRIGGRQQAADWWEDWFRSRHIFMGTEFRFQTSEGRILTPTEIETEFPDANQFDELET